MARGRAPVFFSTGQLQEWGWEEPSVNPMNSTAGEQWEFDGVSDDGLHAFIFGVYRDPNYSFLGTGNLRVHAEFSRPNGTRYSIIDYAEESTIISCPGHGTRGTWRGDGFEYTFQVSSEMSRVEIQFQNPEANLTITMDAVVPPRYANNELWSPFSPSTTVSNATMSTVPHFYWVEPVPVAVIKVEGWIQEHGPVEWTGMGGHERLWGAFNWPTCLAGLTAARLKTGPFALSFIEFISAREKGLELPSFILAENGKVIFTSQRILSSYEGDEYSGSEDYAVVTKTYGGSGATTERLKDKATGMHVALVSPGRHQSWEFAITHKNILFEYALTEGLGGTGYSGMAKGGLSGSHETWEGPAFTEIMRFPDDWWLLSKNYKD